MVGRTFYIRKSIEFLNHKEENRKEKNRGDEPIQDIVHIYIEMS
jgi:hypothetical protein